MGITKSDIFSSKQNKLASVFERFRQVEANDQKVHKGTGLGLAIAKAIVEMHQGKMAVDSVEGKGSTFWFTIPATESVYKALQAEKVAKENSPSEQQR